MSESQVSTLLRRLGLWARRHIELSQDGRVLGGGIDTEAECLYQQLFELHDKVLDRVPLTRVQALFLDYCKDFLAPHRAAIVQLERQFA